MSKISTFDKVPQDWEPVVIKKRPVAKKSNTVVMEKRVDKSGEGSRMRKLDNSDDIVAVPKMTVELRNQIQQARSVKGYTQKRLAELMSVPVSMIQSYENGKVVPKGAFIARLERVLGCKLSRPKKVKRVSE